MVLGDKKYRYWKKGHIADHTFSCLTAQSFVESKDSFKKLPVTAVAHNHVTSNIRLHACKSAQVLKDFLPT